MSIIFGSWTKRFYFNQIKYLWGFKIFKQLLITTLGLQYIYSCSNLLSKSSLVKTTVNANCLYQKKRNVSCPIKPLFERTVIWYDCLFLKSLFLSSQNNLLFTKTCFLKSWTACASLNMVNYIVSQVSVV